MEDPDAMKRVWSGSSLPDTAHFKNVLEQHGIECIIKNRELGGGIGDLPVFDAAPELWVLDAEQAARATAVIRESVRPAAPGLPWRCATCGEENEPQFAVCWRCGRRDARPAESV
jgi:hypothetical protein